MVAIESAENIYTEKYTEALNLIQECRESFSSEKLALAVRLLIETYNHGVKQEQIFSLLSQMLNKPNTATLRKTYEANCQRVLAAMRSLKMPGFTAMPFQMFPLSETDYYLFDYQHKVFLDRFHIKTLWWVFAELALKKTIPAQAEFMVELLQSEYNNAQARRLFAELCKRLETGESSNSLYQNICQYGKLRPQCEVYDWLLGKYYVNSREYEVAEKWARQGWSKRKFNFSLSLLLAEICVQLGKLAEAAALYVSLADTPQGKQSDFSVKIQSIILLAQQISEQTARDVLQQMSLRASYALKASALNTFSLAADGDKLQQTVKLRLGHFLAETASATDFFVGVYNDDSSLDSKAEEIAQLALLNKYQESLAMRNYQFDFFQGSLADQFTAVQPSEPYVLAIAPTLKQQKIYFTYGGKVNTLPLGQYECSFIRVEEELQISAEAPFIIGNKVSLRHQSNRRKLVLNIELADLPGAWLRQEEFADMPNLKRFFARGLIFTNAYAAAEAGYPAVAAIETGCYQHKTGIFQSSAYVKIADEMTPLSQRLHECGYYCVNIAGASESLHNGIARGYDRVIMAGDTSRLSDSVEQTLRQLAAFQETDTFISLRCSAIRSPQDNAPVDLADQTTMSLAQRAADRDALDLRRYRKAARDTDNALGALFAFIEENDLDDEMLVTVYSANDNHTFRSDPYLLSEEKAGAVLMLRGANVPEQTVCDEMVCVMDIYSILGHLVGYETDEQRLDSRLPKVFGGSGREYVISQALIPGQPYRLCIRTKQHEFRLQTDGSTTYDGQINLTAFVWELRRRDALPTKIFDQALLEYFMNIVYQHTLPMRVFLPSEEF